MSGTKGATAGAKNGMYVHGGCGTRLYKIWCSMHERCQRQKHKHYMSYGGRGIAVCEEWNEYIPFYDWAMANGYRDDLTIDRKDINGNYCPENCKWATNKEQQNNKRTNRVMVVNGISHTISEWAEITGIGKTTIRYRLNKGWTPEDVLLVPIQKRKRGYRPSKTGGNENE